MCVYRSHSVVYKHLSSSSVETYIGVYVWEPLVCAHQVVGGLCGSGGSW
jgi:hypothetical protein